MSIDVDAIQYINHISPSGVIQRGWLENPPDLSGGFFGKSSDCQMSRLFANPTLPGMAIWFVLLKYERI